MQAERGNIVKKWLLIVWLVILLPFCAGCVGLSKEDRAKFLYQARTIAETSAEKAARKMVDVVVEEVNDRIEDLAIKAGTSPEVVAKLKESLGDAVDEAVDENIDEIRGVAGDAAVEATDAALPKAEADTNLMGKILLMALNLGAGIAGAGMLNPGESA